MSISPFICLFIIFALSTSLWGSGSLIEVNGSSGGGQGSSSPSPYQIDFESSEGFVSGQSFFASDWIVNGSSSISALGSASGNQSLLFDSLTTLRYTPQNYLVGPSGILFVDFFAKPHAFDELPSQITAQIIAAALRKNTGSNTASYYIINDGAWEETTSIPSIDQDDQTVNWQRYTYRLNFTTKQLDIYVDNQLLAYDIPFIDNTITGFTEFSLLGGTSFLFDYYYQGEANPLFDDNGTGLPASYGPRESDSDNDGLISIEEYQLGLLDNNPDTDGDGWSDYQELLSGTDPLIAENFIFSSLPFKESFDDKTDGNLHPQNNWTTLSGSADVQSADARSGKAVHLTATTEPAIIYNLFSAKNDSTLWLDFYIKPELYSVGNQPIIQEPSTAAFYFDTSGILQAYDGVLGQWVALSHSPINTQSVAWQRLSILKDYTNQTFDLYLNAEKVADQFGFAHPSPYFSQFLINQASYLDDLSITALAPPLLGIDSDANGLDDFWEVTFLGGLGQNSNADPDQDGLNNAQESSQGKHPLVADNDSSVSDYLYVDNATGRDVNDGLRIDNAKETLTSAFTAAPDQGAIIVLPGNHPYQETLFDLNNREIILNPVGNVTINFD